MKIKTVLYYFKENKNIFGKYFLKIFLKRENVIREKIIKGNKSDK